MDTLQKSTPLSLIIDNTIREKTLRKFSHLSDSVWAHKPREVAILERNYLLLDSVRVRGVPCLTQNVLQSVWKFGRTGEKDEGVDKMILIADKRADEMRQIIQKQLHDPRWESVFRTSSITPEIRSSFKNMLDAFLIHFGLLSGEIGELSSEGQEHVIANLRQSYNELASLVRKIAGHVITREEIEQNLAKYGYDVCDETVVKLLIFEINKNSTDPQFLALPAHHPYNPLICSVEYDGGTFPELRPVLSLFAFLDEYPS